MLRARGAEAQGAQDEEGDPMTEMRIPLRYASRCKLGIVMWNRLGFEIGQRAIDEKIAKVLSEMSAEDREAVLVEHEARHR